MYGLDMINTSVLGALGCDMNTFLRYFPAAETMYSLLVALAIGLILLGWVWNLFKNYGLGLGIEAEDPVTSIKKEEYLRSAETMQGIEISENDGILEIKLPCLLPKRRQRQSTEFLLDPFTSALSDYAAHHTMPQFQHCVVCFSHIYAQKLPERRIRDYDNLELKQFLDVAASFILTDDNGLLCDAYNTTELGEEDCTRLFLMDSTQFPAWLAERQNSVKTISDF